MRRSKSNLAKYARNYRKISQRHMTGCGGGGGGGKGRFDEAKERKRLEAILQQSEQTWKRGLAQSGRAAEDEGTKGPDDQGAGGDVASASLEDEGEREDGMLSLLSPELREQFSGMGGDSLLVLPGKKKSKPKKPSPPPLAPQEIKAAKALYKNAQRKLNQLEQRKRQKELRAGLYRQLEEHALLEGHKSNEGEGADAAAAASNRDDAISARDAQSLLLKSSELGKKVTKKERLKQLRRKEALGIKLTEEETNVLYVKYDAPKPESFPRMAKQLFDGGSIDGGTADGDGDDNSEERGPTKDEMVGPMDGKKQKKKKKKKRSKRNVEEEDKRSSKGTVCDEGKPAEENTKQTTKRARLDEGPNSHVQRDPPTETELDRNDSPNTVAVTEKQSMDTDAKKTTAAATTTANATNDHDAAKPKQSYSQMMFASLTSLKTKTDSRNEQLAEEKARERREEEDRARELEEEERKRRKVYVPEDTVKVSTMHHLLDDSDAGRDINEHTDAGAKQGRNVVQHVNRPASIEKSRYDLPVSGMEYEIVDAVRSNDCTILCGETGSGKSTQVPQFLYEAGFSTCGWWKKSDGDDGPDEAVDQSKHLLIGVTQPRRVAAVSTAKRVCYEMGQGNGQSISKSNLVSYQTRYESAGLGPSTHVKFMTDGILLQEIQSDLLLRKYGAIVIDEAHERNLNTDVLLGLLSAALPLRRKAAQEGSLPPLKLVIMSATLRVEDFTENERLFPQESKPALVKVPGRTHPVSIHHSKVTELDDYEKVATEKVCKIHRKLPPGGILVFLTGKQEIMRCVNRLKQRLEPSKRDKKTQQKKKESFGEDDANQQSHGGESLDTGFRDMDDDEVDGDIFQKDGGEDDDFANTAQSEDADIDSGISVEDNQPEKVRILPLYSMLSSVEQAKVFAPVPDDTRLIVVATNIAETSITIPGISYVVDSGRQKVRNFHAGTGVASYDIMWISKAAADQRAGRAGRTGPGHCYRLYSSSVYSRYLDAFALPEVLTRPLEDVVLAMKAMNVSNVTSFPFPTPPDQSQVNAAVRLLANLGCVDVSQVEERGGDGTITALGAAVAKLPLGVRYGKMLLVAAKANILDYALVVVAVLSESTPFVYRTEDIANSKPGLTTDKPSNDVDQNEVIQKEKEHKRELKIKWMHDGGDVLAAVKAVGAYSFAGRGAGGSSEKLACRNFCEENGLHFVVMQRIARMRLHLCKLAKARMAYADGIAAETGRYLPSMPPPARSQECLLRQAIASGLLDNVARRAPPGILPEEFAGIPRSAYICANSSLKEPLFIDNNSTMHSRRPDWVCFDSVVRKTKKDGSTIATMQKVTPVDPEWLATLCHGSNLVTLGLPLTSPVPRYAREKDSIQCAVSTKFGGHGWEIPPCYVGMYEKVHNGSQKKQNSAVMRDDSFRWFGRYLLEGKIFPELSGLLPMLNDEPSIITRRRPAKKVMLLVSALSDAGVDSASALQKHWAEKDDKFLAKALKLWVKRDCMDEAKRIWINNTLTRVNVWKCRK